jgi:two-component system, OmpR family, response regulator ResD
LRCQHPMRPVSELDRQESQQPNAPRLLIVEDEISTVFAMREFFSFNGYQVDCASGEPDAMTFLDRSAYDVVITDLHLTPHRCAEGMTVLARARSRNPRALIVMLTAYGSEGSEHEAYNHGVNLYETKPVGLAKLAASIEAARTDRSRQAAKTNGEWGGSCPE